MKTVIFECMECGKKFYSVTAARRAMNGDEGCPGCGGSDIDLPRVKAEPAAALAAMAERNGPSWDRDAARGL